MTKQPQPPVNCEAASLRIFLIEDSRTVRELLIEYLSDIEGLEFSGFAATQSEALVQLRSRAFDVVIFDIELLQGNGINVLRSLAQSPTLSDSLKIIFSNNVSSTCRRIGMQYGVHHFFDKTTELPGLHALLMQTKRDATQK